MPIALVPNKWLTRAMALPVKKSALSPFSLWIFTQLINYPAPTPPCSIRMLIGFILPPELVMAA